MPAAKLKVSRVLRSRVKAYDQMANAIQDGLASGWAQAHKHSPPRPSAEAIRAAMYSAITSAICDVFDFDDEDA